MIFFSSKFLAKHKFSRANRFVCSSLMDTRNTRESFGVHTTIPEIVKCTGRTRRMVKLTGRNCGGFMNSVYDPTLKGLQHSRHLESICRCNVLTLSGAVA